MFEQAVNRPDQVIEGASKAQSTRRKVTNILLTLTRFMLAFFYIYSAISKLFNIYDFVEHYNNSAFLLGVSPYYILLIVTTFEFLLAYYLLSAVRFSLYYYGVLVFLIILLAYNLRLFAAGINDCACTFSVSGDSISSVMINILIVSLTIVVTILQHSTNSNHDSALIRHDLCFLWFSLLVFLTVSAFVVLHESYSHIFNSIEYTELTPGRFLDDHRYDIFINTIYPNNVYFIKFLELNYPQLMAESHIYILKDHLNNNTINDMLMFASNHLSNVRIRIASNSLGQAYNHELSGAFIFSRGRLQSYVNSKSLNYTDSKVLLMYISELNTFMHNNSGEIKHSQSSSSDGVMTLYLVTDTPCSNCDYDTIKFLDGVSHRYGYKFITNLLTEKTNKFENYTNIQPFKILGHTDYYPSKILLIDNRKTGRVSIIPLEYVRPCLAMGLLLSPMFLNAFK